MSNLSNAGRPRKITPTVFTKVKEYVEGGFKTREIARVTELSVATIRNVRISNTFADYLKIAGPKDRAKKPVGNEQALVRIQRLEGRCAYLLHAVQVLQHKLNVTEGERGLNGKPQEALVA